MILFSLTDQFLKSAAQLQKDTANKTFKTLLQFYVNPQQPGLNFEKLRGKAAALRSIRVDLAFRIIFQQTSTTTFFHFVGNHNDAYRAADRTAPVIAARLRQGVPA